jgi:ABC-type antimicrobial peptide transport system permease subunit
MEIVGVVPDVIYTSIRDPVPATVFIPFAQADMGATDYMSANLNVRTRENPSAALTRRIADIVNEVNPGVSVAFRELSEQVDASMTQDKIMAELSAFFGVLALLLAAVGLYGITAYGVSRRRAELGIRLSLGAAPAGIVRLVLARIFALVLIGIALGAAVSFWASRFVGSLLYGLAPRDPATMVGAAVLLAVVAALAGWRPAWRASRIQPADVLRES